MNAKNYLADLTAGGLLLAESRPVAQLLLHECNEIKWHQEIVDRNLLQKKSPQTALRYARTIKRRIEPLGPQLWQDLVDVHDALYRQLLLMASLLHAPVIADFMREVLGESYRIYLPYLKADAWASFIEPKYRVIEGLTRLSESTLHKSGANVIRMLVESGYLNNNRERKIQPVYLLPETRRWLVLLGREELAVIMECTV